MAAVVVASMVAVVTWATRAVVKAALMMASELHC